MNKYDKLKTEPQRVWINAPSSLNNYSKYHGRVGIAFTQEKTSLEGKYWLTTIYFTEGNLKSMHIDPKFLELENSQNNNLKYDNK